MCLDDEEASFRAIVPNAETKSCAPRDNDIVSLVVGQQAEICLQHSNSIVDKVDLVTFRIAVVVVHGNCGLRDSQCDILIEHQHLTTQYGIATARQVGGLEMMMALHCFIPFLKLLSA